MSDLSTSTPTPTPAEPAQGPRIGRSVSIDRAAELLGEAGAAKGSEGEGAAFTDLGAAVEPGGDEALRIHLGAIVPEAARGRGSFALRSAVPMGGNPTQVWV